MPEHERPPRVLQLIGDTDVTTEHLAALALHRELQACGLEVRTLALAPGRVGGLEHDVPAISPSRRSLSARGQVAGESRWADVVVVHAPRALTIATTPGPRDASPPRVVAHWTVDSAREDGRAARRVHAAASAVVAASPRIADALAAGTGGGGALVVPADLEDPMRPRPDGAAWGRLLSELAATTAAG